MISVGFACFQYASHWCFPEKFPKANWLVLGSRKEVLSHQNGSTDSQRWETDCKCNWYYAHPQMIQLATGRSFLPPVNGPMVQIAGLIASVAQGSVPPSDVCWFLTPMKSSSVYMAPINPGEIRVQHGSPLSGIQIGDPIFSAD